MLQMAEYYKRPDILPVQLSLWLCAGGPAVPGDPDQMPPAQNHGAGLE